MNATKKLILPLFILLLSAILLAIMPTEADAAIYRDTVRLHILANSDSEEDQALKLRVRDKLLVEYASLFSEATSCDEAAERAEAALPQIETSVREWILAWGYDYAVQVTLSTEWYDTRVYEDFTLPKGYYTSLRVLIGEGAGHNWWCVMFPPLCLDMAVEEAPEAEGKYTETERFLIGGGQYQPRFKILELLSEAFS